jgi:2'-5' RNA ligase
MRLFFALWPDDDTRAAIDKAGRAAVRHAGGRPVPVQHYHVTLAFLGQLPAGSLDAIVTAGRIAADAAVNAPLDLRLDRFGYWPKPRVLWMGPSECPRSVASLATRLWDALSDLEITREVRPLQPHVTLCRKVQRAPELKPPRAVDWRAAGFVLVESVTAPRGAEYTVVARFPGTHPEASPGAHSGGSSHDP